MRILTRYILGEILSHALIGCALFTFILFMPRLPQILEMVVRNSSSFSSAFEVFLFLLPNLFWVTIPMSVLVGILLGLSRLAADSEIIAMRASGLGIGYFVRVASIVAVAGALLGTVNSLWVAPRANQAILEMQQSLAASQASYQIQPRVFYEDFHDKVLYVQDVRSGTGAANWKQIFMADVSDPAAPKITTAESATVVNDSSLELLMRLRNGEQHEGVPGHPDQYNVSTFDTTDLPLTLSPQGDVHLGRMDTAVYAIPTRTLLQRIHQPDNKRFLIELNNRFAYPAACLVLMLVGVPLGVMSRRGGKSSGFVFTLLLVIIYYVLSYTGVALARQDKLPPTLAVWLANIIFTIAGSFLLWQMATGGGVIAAIAGLTARTPKSRGSGIATVLHDNGSHLTHLLERRPRSVRKAYRGAFPRILDAYVMREFLTMFLMVLCGFVMLMLVFTFFELVGDIIRNHIALTTVGLYLVNLTPSMLYTIAPLAVLIAVLVTFGVLNRNSEIVAMKATGISLYRLVIPILVIAGTLAISLFAFDEFYLPQANRRQEQLRSTIKGRPPQTFLHPEQKWIFGQPRAGERGRIFYYQFFDHDAAEFANLSIFEFDPMTFALSRRIFAGRVYWDRSAGSWVFQNGWVREFQGANQKDFREFKDTTFGEIHEEPGYFSKESLQSQEMNFGQLDRYIRDLRQSGFDTMRLRVALWHKLAYPLVAVVMAMLAIPFALSMGRRGSLTGIAVAIGVALTYWMVMGLFEAMGNVNYLPAPLAAWSSDVLFGLTGGYLLLKTPT
ncbi:LPS export ABC transporter permease LptF [Occallatibacter riparius]|uniref:LPS export ABC transporter permease LptF n=1 Tax=Occallatibacter riparius TaxID=1002689 RepID=A0A9J7BKQ4_9BACT|nr:LPS export ABC transporter permease LptF [Occallatibacter riparius]UWZ83231.1 LPS export ABC transporter permease LptF [Occallatibacter riparius]